MCIYKHTLKYVKIKDQGTNTQQTHTSHSALSLQVLLSIIEGILKIW